ncbi:hypothetical protein D9M69_567070 [compost metagenome]
MKSSSSTGPRTPYFSEFWLSAMGTPWLVVSICPEESTRTRSSDSMVQFTPSVATPPVFSEWFSSESVLPDGSRDCGSTVAPGSGDKPFWKPCSPALVGLKGMDSARCPVCTALAALLAPFALPRVSVFLDLDTVRLLNVVMRQALRPLPRP